MLHSRRISQGWLCAGWHHNGTALAHTSIPDLRQDLRNSSGNLAILAAILSRLVAREIDLASPQTHPHGTFSFSVSRFNINSKLAGFSSQNRTMPSKHANAGRLVQRGLYDDLRSFTELEERISALGDENTKIVGDAFEVFVEGYLATHQKMQAETVWLVGQVPLDIRQQLNLPNDTKGIDGIFRTRIGTLVPYQVKFRSQRAYLTYTEIAPFLGLTERAADRIVFTNSNELAEDVKNRDAMRTVRGIDFDDLTEDDFRTISCWLREQPVAIPKLSPRLDQIEALRRIGETLANSDRAHVVMACGTGKTLVALWAAEALKPTTVLVLVPSLMLLQQILDDWSRHNNWGTAFSYICVCSDPELLRDKNDTIAIRRSDAEFRVDTDPDVVRRFIQRYTPNSIKVVFSTYQSSPIVSEGMRGLPPFDIAVFDEAHKTATREGSFFAHSLSDENVRIQKRLFLTATPRKNDIRHRDREGDFKFASMNDETVYGPRAYTLTFGEAAQQGIICNYKVVISVVDGQEINDFTLKHGITLAEGDLIRAGWVANQIAIERAIDETGAKRAITFHSRVSSAKEFSADGARGIKQFLPEFYVSHVNGEQKSSERKQLIRDFRDAPKALITNARCLTEGIDVPAVDMVAFIDPRHSKIDIAQATGRAMRKPRGSNKEVGYVVIPLFLERESEETLEEALKRSEFSDVADVLNAMQEQDDDLVQIVREMQEAKGRGELFDPKRLSEKIEVIEPAIELSALKSNIFAEIVNTIGISWDEMFGKLVLFREKQGHCRVPGGYEDGKLGKWVSHQRRFAKLGTLSSIRKQRLDQIGFAWDPYETDWEEGYLHLKAYKERCGHCRVPLDHQVDGFPLGEWAHGLRTRKSSLTVERLARLEELGFTWGLYEADWESGFGCLKTFKEREGHCRVPKNHKENGFNLGQWVNNQRRLKAQIPVERRQRLDALGFMWDLYEADWEKGYGYLKIYKDRTGHCLVPQNHKENGFRLGRWVSIQRRERISMPEQRREKLDELGFVWDVLAYRWEEGFRHLKDYKERGGHCRVPVDHKHDGFALGAWTRVQRRDKDKMSVDRRERLDELGFVWDSPFDTLWEKGFNYLKTFKEREGHCRVPPDHKENGYNLGSWVSVQRGLKAEMPIERRQRLDALGFVWNARETNWDEGYRHLKLYKERCGHCRVPVDYRQDGYPLGAWARAQRVDKDKMSVERRARLDELGLVWDPFETAWERGFNYLKIYKERMGHCRVPKDHNENGFPLGKWVSTQRSKERTMPVERRRRLDTLGFVWKVQKPTLVRAVRPQELES